MISSSNDCPVQEGDDTSALKLDHLSPKEQYFEQEVSSDVSQADQWDLNAQYAKILCLEHFF